MIEINNVIVHFDILRECFACDVSKCKGVCCIEGDSGAPLEESEIQKIYDVLPFVIEKLSDEAKKIIAEKGPTMIDIEGDTTTNICGEKGACVFVMFNKNGFAECALENAWQNGLTNFRKPISCHLYPIRIKKYSNFEAVNYHVWDICKDAIINGKNKNIKIFEFTKHALIRKYGESWYNELCETEKLLSSNNEI